MLNFTIAHVNLDSYITTQFLMTVLDMSLELTLEPITVYRWGLGSIWIFTVGQGTSVEMLSLFRHEVEAVMSTKSRRE